MLIVIYTVEFSYERNEEAFDWDLKFFVRWPSIPKWDQWWQFTPFSKDFLPSITRQTLCPLISRRLAQDDDAKNGSILSMYVCSRGRRNKSAFVKPKSKRFLLMRRNKKKNVPSYFLSLSSLTCIKSFRGEERYSKQEIIIFHCSVPKNFQVSNQEASFPSPSIIHEKFSKMRSIPN